MYNVLEIKSEFSKLVSWRCQKPTQIIEVDTDFDESFDTDFDDTVDTDFDASEITTNTPESGLYFNDFHPYLTCANIESIAPLFDEQMSNTAAELKFQEWLKQKTDSAIIKTLNFWLLSKAIRHNNVDYTDFLKSQKSKFSNIIGLGVAIEMLRELAFNANARINRGQANINTMQVLYEIDGDSSSLKKAGLKYQFDLACKAIALPRRRKGVRYRSI